jgi:putative acetyltransferase
VRIRSERPEDHAAIRAVTVAAFSGSPYGHNGEADIVEALRADGVLSVSLVADAAGEVVGHAAFSPVRITTAEGDWYGLGPISVVLGDPGYYGRFGFQSDPAIRYGSEVSPYLQRLALRGSAPSGEVRYHSSFDG